ncbi:MAG: biotin synthase BioB [Desulfuromonas sp.]|nr:biotin synthase BioB [Desulfuromonas sp.]
MKYDVQEMSALVLAGETLSAEQALRLVDGGEAADEQTHGQYLATLQEGSEAIRRHYCGERVELCSIINAKSGRCAENCAFCAQSQYHSTAAPVYPLQQPDKLVEAAKRAEQGGARCFSLVTSGTRVQPGAELDTLLAVIERIASQCHLDPSVSLGLLDSAIARRLADAGCVTYHHNLETSRSFFSQVCTTHAYQQAIDTITIAQQAGLRVCSGGILGMGETWAQRVELACTLRDLHIDSVAINFLTPVPGTPLAEQPPLTPEDCLKSISLFRYLLPQARISICGGRQYQLATHQAEIFRAGASGMMIGDFLTTPGSALCADHQLLNQAGVRLQRFYTRCKVPSKHRI